MMPNILQVNVQKGSCSTENKAVVEKGKVKNEMKMQEQEAVGGGASVRASRAERVIDIRLIKSARLMG